jgi:hypothetical protein
MKPIMSAVFVAAIALTACSKNADVQCTTATQDTWKSEQTFREELLAKGYIIDEFKVTPGNCYEIYGKNPEQTKVEIYFNPVDGAVIKEETK